MSNPNGQRGAAAERALVVWLRANGYPDAVRARGEGSVDRGDIGGIPRVAVQVKSAMRDAYVMPRLRDAQHGALEQAHGRRPVAVVKLPGVGDPAQWWAATPTLHQPGLCPVDHPLVLDRCSVHTLRNVLSWRGGAVRAGWWITTVSRLFAALPREVAA